MGVLCWYIEFFDKKKHLVKKSSYNVCDFLPKSILLVSCKKCVAPIRLLFTAAYCDKKVRDLNVYHFSVTKVFFISFSSAIIKILLKHEKKL